MFDPLQVCQAADCRPVDYYSDQLDEEHYAQRYGSVVPGRPVWNRFNLWLGRLLLRIAEKLTGECYIVALSRKTA